MCTTWLNVCIDIYVDSFIYKRLLSTPPAQSLDVVKNTLGEYSLVLHPMAIKCTGHVSRDCGTNSATLLEPWPTKFSPCIQRASSGSPTTPPPHFIMHLKQIWLPTNSHDHGLSECDAGGTRRRCESPSVCPPFLGLPILFERGEARLG
jgi:hypothetical protein